MAKQSTFNPACRQCPRLDKFLTGIRQDYPNYHAAPVPPFGDPKARLLIVGLAPGMHGANRTGRPFTGDYAGILLYQTLHKFGYGNLPESIAADDDLVLTGCRITNAVKCLPPANKPTTEEEKTCNPYFKAELATLPKNAVLLTLGNIAHKAVLRALDLKQSQFRFAHNAVHKLEQLTLVNSYHCSRYNTQTRRLTEKMFHDVFSNIDKILKQNG
ncbi:MAG: uracil-DNA glycosylase [Gammaproteobacteria bacterium]|nr:uracil-DNA glycosylase [Gammaproteobacteria bacterium]